MANQETRGRSNGNEAGSAKDRRARRIWLVSPSAGFGGDGEKVLCQVCFSVLVYAEHRVRELRLFVGRIVPGHQGGTYRRANVRPECHLCSCREGQRLTTQLRVARQTFNTRTVSNGSTS